MQQCKTQWDDKVIYIIVWYNVYMKRWQNNYNVNTMKLSKAEPPWDQLLHSDCSLHANPLSWSLGQVKLNSNRWKLKEFVLGCYRIKCVLGSGGTYFFTPTTHQKKLWKTPINNKNICNLKTTTHKIQFKKSHFLVYSICPLVDNYICEGFYRVFLLYNVDSTMKGM